MGLYSNLSQGIRACHPAVPSNSGKFPMMKRILKHIFTYNYFDSKTRYSLSILMSRKHQTHCPCIQATCSTILLASVRWILTWHVSNHLAMRSVSHLHCHGMVAIVTGNAPPSWNDNTQSHLLVPCGNDIIFVTLASRTKCNSVKGSPRPQACAPQWCWNCNACDVTCANVYTCTSVNASLLSMYLQHTIHWPKKCDLYLYLYKYVFLEVINLQ